MTSPTLAEINQLVDDLFQQEAKLSAARNEIKALDELADSTRAKIMQVLDDSGLKSFKANAGTVTCATRYNVKFPKDPDLKAGLQEYLLGKGAFDGLWSVNHQTLNSFFKVEAELAEAEGRLVDVPGLEPTADKYLQFRKGGN